MASGRGSSVETRPRGCEARTRVVPDTMRHSGTICLPPWRVRPRRLPAAGTVVFYLSHADLSRRPAPPTDPHAPPGISGPRRDLRRLWRLRPARDGRRPVAPAARQRRGARGDRPGPGRQRAPALHRGRRAVHDRHDRPPRAGHRHGRLGAEPRGQPVHPDAVRPDHQRAARRDRHDADVAARPRAARCRSRCRAR